MPRLLVIADDLTGANDAGVQFAKSGVATLVLPEMPDFQIGDKGYQVVAVNTETRHLPSDEAAARVTTIVEKAMQTGFTHFYKKTDSSLRGNIGSEMEALMIASACTLLPFVPAFPRLGRTTRAGHQYVKGQLLHESSFAHDPLEPMRESFIPSIIARQSTVSTHVLSPSSLREKPRSRGEASIAIVDAVDDADLKSIADSLASAGGLRVTAGSGGFAEVLAHLIPFTRTERLPVSEKGRILVVNGSLNETSRRQAQHAFSNKFSPVELVLPAAAFHQNGEALVEMPISAALSELGRDEDVIISARFSEIKGRVSTPEPANAESVHEFVARHLAELTRQSLADDAFKVLVVFGGDTLLAIARACGWKAFLPQCEVLPGVVAARIADDDNAPLLITKAGGFGDENVLPAIRNSIRSN